MDGVHPDQGSSIQVPSLRIQGKQLVNKRAAELRGGLTTGSSGNTIYGTVSCQTANQEETKPTFPFPAIFDNFQRQGHVKKGLLSLLPHGLVQLASERVFVVITDGKVIPDVRLRAGI